MDKTQTKCEWCGKVFTPTDDNLVESGFAAEDLPDEIWLSTPMDKSPIEANEAQKQEIKQALELNDQDLKILLETGSVLNGFSYVCDECQNEEEECDCDS